MNPGQQVRHYSLVCRRMCLDGAGLDDDRRRKNMVGDRLFSVGLPSIEPTEKEEMGKEMRHAIAQAIVPDTFLS